MYIGYYGAVMDGYVFGFTKMKNDFSDVNFGNKDLKIDDRSQKVLIK